MSQTATASKSAIITALIVGAVAILVYATTIVSNS